MRRRGTSPWIRKVLLACPSTSCWRRERLRVPVVELALRVDMHATMCAIVVIRFFFAPATCA
jgi:hypothetical protein